MKELTVGKNDAGQRLDKFLSKAYPALPPSLMYKYIRTKRIKRAGARTAAEYRLCEGDVLQLYINDELLEGREEDKAVKSLSPRLAVVYEDANILIADKPAGMLVHSDDAESYNTLINHIKAYLFQKGEYDPENERSFAPALCNRIDRNTAGLCVAAKNAEALREMNEIIKGRLMKKSYLALVTGCPNPSSATLTAYLSRDMEEKRVSVFDRPGKDRLQIITKYRTLHCKDSVSLLEIDLVTGRTHQIRAHMAHIGHPLVGDGKYGKTGSKGATGQALCARRLRFELEDFRGILSYLDKKEFFSSQTKIFDDFLQNP
ncbi:MAG TPA: RluA family pseudouridine synthase [Candidatus Acidoferrum sp.]|nr:RluA family pseudouridine synthase [Candidatus Acidoferrum sp.]